MLDGWGNAQANHLWGNAAANHLYGEGGDDLIDGGGGADTLAGGGGDDRYIVDHAGDLVSEQAGEGTDQVDSAVSADS